MKCLICGREKFIAHQLIRADIFVDGDGKFTDNIGDNLEDHIYDSGRPYGPFTCNCCGAEYEELDGAAPITLPTLTEISVQANAMGDILQDGLTFSVDSIWLSGKLHGKKVEQLSNADRHKLFMIASCEDKAIICEKEQASI